MIFPFLIKMKNSPETLLKCKLKRKELKEKIDKSLIPKIKLRICKDCNLEKECRFMYSFTISGEPEYRTRCIDCFKIWEKSHRKKTRKNLNYAQKKRKLKRKLKFIQYLGGKCSICGYNKCSRALTFHHRIRKDKEYSISQIVDWRWDLVKKELDKCELLCFNCHMEMEFIYENNF